MSDTDGPTRRTVLKASSIAAVTGITGLAGCSGGGGGDDSGGGGNDGGGGNNGDDGGNGGSSGGSITKTFKLDGKTAGWVGKKPSGIEGKTNPTLNLTAGKKYKVTWVNKDGIPHNFQLLDKDGNVLKKTKTVSEKGKTLSLTFTASKKMKEYNCKVHPSAMRGDVKLG